MWIKERVKKQKLFQSLLFERDGRAWHQVTTLKGKGGGMSNPRLKWVGTRTQTTWFESPGVPGLTEASSWQMTKSGCLLIVCQSWNHGEETTQGPQHRAVWRTTFFNIHDGITVDKRSFIHCYQTLSGEMGLFRRYEAQIQCRELHSKRWYISQR